MRNSCITSETISFHTWQMASNSDALNSATLVDVAPQAGTATEDVTVRYPARSVSNCGLTVVSLKWGLVMRCSTTGTCSSGPSPGAGLLVLLKEP
jgi:hypothetical protein